MISNYDIGDNIRAARKAAGLNLTQVASAIGFERGAVLRRENGRTPILAEDIPAFALVTRVPLAWFFEKHYGSDSDRVRQAHQAKRERDEAERLTFNNTRKDGSNQP